jgi:hypothetical protein
VHVRNDGINCPARQTLMVPRRTRRRVVPHTFGNEETDILPELDKFNYIIAGKKFVTLAVFREGMINDEDLDIVVASCTGNLDQPYASYKAIDTKPLRLKLRMCKISLKFRDCNLRL